MKVYLDAERATPSGWHRVYNRDTGYDVLLLLEAAVLPKVSFH